MIKVIIIDDELKAIKSLKIRIERSFDDIEIVATAQSAAEGKHVIEKYRPDLVFLDIEMPKGNAFTLLEQLNSIFFKVIFVTAYNEYALQAIKINALDYILKPIDEDELVAAINKFKSKHVSDNHPQKIRRLTDAYQKYNSQSIRIALPVMGGVEYIQLSQIIYCEADNNYTKIYLDGGSSKVISKTLKYFEDSLKDLFFMRVHQSYLVNLFKVIRFEKSNRGRIVLSNETTINLSQNKKEEFLSRISQLTGI